MDVCICGPNLSRSGQAKGCHHVHAADCNDLNYYGPGRRFGGDWNGFKETVIKDATVKDCVLHVYDNGILDEAVAESGRPTLEVAQGYVSEFWFAPCCSKHLPDGWDDGWDAEGWDDGWDAEGWDDGWDAEATPAQPLRTIFECWVPGKTDSFTKHDNVDDALDWFRRTILETNSGQTVIVGIHDSTEYTS